jgi:alkanesulfonate monooxygenase SsuD/methylene tetrahydromethanopterin reductase-like flavin-dependent oxidoreductase (luciferase family)
VARYAGEWNCVNLAPDAFRHKLEVLARHCEAAGRDPATVHKSMMAFGIVGPTEASLDTATRRVMSMFGAPEGTTLAGFRAGMKQRGFLVGTTEEVVDTLGKLAALGMEEVQFQHFDFDSDEVPRYLASEVAPKVAGL